MRANDVRTMADLARYIAEMVPRQNPIVPAILLSTPPLTDQPPIATIQLHGARIQAIYSPRIAPVLYGWVFVTRANAGQAAPWVVLATNFQVGSGAESIASGSNGSMLGVGATGVGQTGYPLGGSPGGPGEVGGATSPWTIEDGSLMPLSLGEVAT